MTISWEGVGHATEARETGTNWCETLIDRQRAPIVTAPRRSPAFTDLFRYTDKVLDENGAETAFVAHVALR
jgi:hypothetical protein